MTPSQQKVHAFTNDSLEDFDAVMLSELIKNKKISPKELISDVIKRAEKVNPILNAIAFDRFDLNHENLYETNGFFSGIPLFTKDLTNVKGVPTRFGSRSLVNAKPAKKDDAIIKQIASLGFVHMGHSRMSEFGFTCSTEAEDLNDTRNPWNVNHTPGGSSGGSAALVAAGVVPIAHAADGGGSIRIPAGACGLIGLKPTRGRLLNNKLFENQPIHIAVDGVITRSVRDTSYFYSEAEKHYKNPKLPAMGLVKSPSNKKLKIGYTADSVRGMGADETTRKELQKTITLLESMGHTVKEIKLSIADQFIEDFSAVWAMNAFFMHKFGKVLFEKAFVKKDVSNLTKQLAKHYAKNFQKTLAISKRMKKTHHEYAQMFNDLDVDVFITPTVASSAPEIGHFGMNLDFDTLFDRIINWTCFTPYGNASGGPSISLPLGFDQAKGLPIGMLFWANHGQESLLLDLALQIEETEAWKKIQED
jgi:amidase